MTATRRTWGKCRAHLLAWGMIALPVPAIAGDKDEYYSPWHAGDRAGIEIGALSFSFETMVQNTDSATMVEGTNIDLESVLGLDDHSTDPYFSFYYRLGDRHRLDLVYYDVSRDSNGLTTENVVFGDLIIPAGTPVNTEFDYQIIDANYSYALAQSRWSELAVVAGVYVVNYDTRVEEMALGTSDEQHGTVPLPTIGLRFSQLLSPRWLLAARVNYFDLTWDDIKGRYLSYAMGIDFLASKRLSIGLAYNSLSLSGRRTDEEDSIGIDYDGWTLGTTLRF